MQVVEIDEVGLQTSQRLLTLRHDRFSTGASTIWSAREEIAEKLGRQYDAVPPTFTLRKEVSNNLLGIRATRQLVLSLGPCRGSILPLQADFFLPAVRFRVRKRLNSKTNDCAQRVI
jgi:hypothetical protein